MNFVVGRSGQTQATKLRMQLVLLMTGNMYVQLRLIDGTISMLGDVKSRVRDVENSTAVA